jgi:hypothetical protein
VSHQSWHLLTVIMTLLSILTYLLHWKVSIWFRTLCVKYFVLRIESLTQL